MRNIWRMFGLLLCIALSVSSIVPTALGQIIVWTNKSLYERGETVTITVSGGTPNGVVMIQFNNPGGVEVWADQDNFTSGGAFQYELKIPSGWALGTYTLHVRDIVTLATGSTIFQVRHVRVEEEVGANLTDHIVDALDEAGTTVTINTTTPVTVLILRYPENPYPDVPLPENVIPVFVDIFVSNPDSVIWPIYVERHYTDEEVAKLDETKMAIYYYGDETWHRCFETGVYPEKNVVWAYMRKHEVTGSITVVGALPAAAEFEVFDLVIPFVVRVSDSINISVTVSNVGDDSGSHTVTFKVNGEVVDSKTVTLNGGESTSVGITFVPKVAKIHLVSIDSLTGNFTAIVPSPPLPPVRRILWVWLIGIILAAVAVAGGVYLISRRTQTFVSLSGRGVH